MRSLLSAALLLFAAASIAQTRPFFGSMYFQHQYLANPAMAGTDTGFTAYLAHHQQTGGIDGAASTQALAATYQVQGFRFGALAGADKYGVFSTVRAAASVTYSQPVGGKDQFLHLGISYGGYDRRIHMKDVQGQTNDPVLQQFNGKHTFFDGDLGLAYTDQHLTVQAAVPGFVTAFQKNRDDLYGQMQLFTAVSYRIALDEQTVSEIIPKACYRLLRQADGVADIGARVNFDAYRLGIEGIYHTNSAVTMGVSVGILRRLSLLCMYSSEPPQTRPYVKGDIELGIKTSF